MTEQTPLERGQFFQASARMPVPAARSLDDFSLELVGHDVILFDPVSRHYHTLNDVAFQVWRLCDGQNSIEVIQARLEQSGLTVHIESIRLAAAQLIEAGLLAEGIPEGDLRVQRRKVLRMAAAGTIAAVGLPLVSSITAPHAAAANSATCGFFPDGYRGCGNTGNDTCCCPTSPPNVGNCRNPNGCVVNGVSQCLVP
jgi:hypothetical protein